MDIKKVLITSRSFAAIVREPVELLENKGFELVYYNDSFEEEIFRQQLKDCCGLIIGSHTLSREAVIGAPLLKVVSKHGTGLDNIDLAFMEKQGIVVRNVPAVNAEAVADLAFGLILDVSRQIASSAMAVKHHKWKPSYGLDVHGKTLGLIGFGRIAQCVARRAKGFSMEILAHDPFLPEPPEEFSGYVSMKSLRDILKRSDIISVHIPLNHETRNLISFKEMQQMKYTGILINTSRGGIINENDLVKAVDAGIIYGAGLDVLQYEPPQKDATLIQHPNITVTPHMGMYSRETLAKISLAAAENILLD